MMALNRYRLRHLVKQGHRGAKLARANCSRAPTGCSACILIGNTLVNRRAATWSPA